MSTPRQLIPQDIVVIGNFTVPIPTVAPAKDPVELLDYGVDFSASINRPIGQYDVSITDSPTLVVDHIDCNGGTSLTLWLRGGEVGDIARVAVTAISVIGQTKTITFVLPIEALSVTPTAPDDVITLNGFPLTWGGVSQIVAPGSVTPAVPGVAGRVFTVDGVVVTIGEAFALTPDAVQGQAVSVTIGQQVVTVGGAILTIGTTVALTTNAAPVEDVVTVGHHGITIGSAAITI